MVYCKAPLVQWSVTFAISYGFACSGLIHGRVFVLKTISNILIY